MTETENISYQFEIDQIRDSAEGAAKRLEAEVSRGHHPTTFLVVLCVALFKDFGEGALDFTFFGAFIAPFFGLAVDLFLRYLMKKYGWFEAKENVVKKIKWALYGLSFFLDNIPVIDALPLTTITVFYIHHQMKKRAKEAEIELEDLQYATREEIERIREEAESETSFDEEVDQTLETEEEEEEEAPQGAEGGGTRNNQRIIETRESPSEDATEDQPDQPKKETLEEIFVPQEIRDPLGKLKKDFFETSPDQPTSLPEKDSFKKSNVTPIRPEEKKDLEVQDEDSFTHNKAA